MLAAATTVMAAAVVDLELPQAELKHRSQYQYWFFAPIPNARFGLEELNNQACIELFCFERQHIQWLTQLFELQQAVYLARINLLLPESFCIVFYQLARPESYIDISQLFGQSKSWLSQVSFNGVIENLVQNYHQLIQ